MQKEIFVPISSQHCSFSGSQFYWWMLLWAPDFTWPGSLKRQFGGQFKANASLCHALVSIHPGRRYFASTISRKPAYSLERTRIHSSTHTGLHGPTGLFSSVPLLESNLFGRELYLMLLFNHTLRFFFPNRVPTLPCSIRHIQPPSLQTLRSCSRLRNSSPSISPVCA